MALKRKKKRKALRGKRRAIKRRTILRASKVLLKAYRGADKRGYTGMTNSKGCLFDDPYVKRATKAYDKAVETA